MMKIILYSFENISTSISREILDRNKNTIWNHSLYKKYLSDLFLIFVGFSI